MDVSTGSKRLIIVFFIALSFRLALFAAVGSWRDEVLTERIVIDDSIGYHRLAINLLENKVFSRSEGPPHTPDIFRTPIYPLFLATFYSIAGYKPYVAIALQLIIASATCILIYLIGKDLFDQNTALLAALFLSIECSSILYSNLLLSDTLFTFLFVLHILFLTRFLLRGGLKDLVVSGAFLGLSTLCRPVSIYFCVFLVPVFWCRFRRSPRRGLSAYVVLTLAFLVAILPWGIRNSRASGTLLISSVQRQVLRWSLPRLTEESDILRRLVLPGGQEDQNETARTRNREYGDHEMQTDEGVFSAMVSDSKRYIAGVMGFFTTVGSSKYARLLNLRHYQMQPEDWRKGSFHVVMLAIQKKSVLECAFICLNALFLLFLYVTMCFGIYAALKEKMLPLVALVVCIVAYFALSAPFSPTVRYRLPVMPYIILISSFGALKIRQTVRRRRVGSGRS